MGLVKLTVLDLRNKVPKIQGSGFGLAISPLPLVLFFFLGAGGGCLSLIQVHLLICLGPPFVFITRAFFKIPFGHCHAYMARRVYLHVLV